MQIAMQELKSGLSRYVARAHGGEVIEITSHDRPVARLVGVPAASASALDHLRASGAVDWQGGKPSFRPPVSLEGSGKSLSEMVLDDRG